VSVVEEWVTLLNVTLHDVPEGSPLSVKVTEVGGGWAGATVKIPVSLAESVVDFVAVTVKVVLPAGVAAVVVIVNKAANEPSELSNLISFFVESKHVFWSEVVQTANEPAENDGVTPVGQVAVMVRAALNCPGEPAPVPLFTVRV
jgi:hypothetical protein